MQHQLNACAGSRSHPSLRLPLTVHELPRCDYSALEYLAPLKYERRRQLEAAITWCQTLHESGATPAVDIEGVARDEVRTAHGVGGHARQVVERVEGVVGDDTVGLGDLGGVAVVVAVDGRGVAERGLAYRIGFLHDGPKTPGGVVG